MDRPRALALVVGVLLLLVGCSSGTDPGESDAGPEPEPDGTTLVISDFTYQVPEGLSAGETITVRNEDSVGHTVTSDEEGIFDVSVGPGEEVAFTVPDAAGEYPFHCTPHPNMTATLTVES
ncbi:cupredoxin domain-containing protein [Ruania rhizosphaerae]|uniref:cupredoxin domain-containing protein n=1 Tax=Ruania rhizosphaerae TaxID=1840413 RepID=UPI00135A63B0|nr:cupredoxin domain-containing protein [Ruania rhizosphaerae]